MPKNNRLPATVTRSISWRFDLLAAIDTRAEELRLDRSSLINGIMEHVLGLSAHPEVMGRNAPFHADVDRKWETRAAELELEGKRDRETKRVRRAVTRVAGPSILPPGFGLVRRPGAR